MHSATCKLLVPRKGQNSKCSECTYRCKLGGSVWGGEGVGNYIKFKFANKRLLCDVVSYFVRQ